jgi:hypothetical protein
MSLASLGASNLDIRWMARLGLSDHAVLSSGDVTACVYQYGGSHFESEAHLPHRGPCRSVLTKSTVSSHDQEEKAKR